MTTQNLTQSRDFETAPDDERDVTFITPEQRARRVRLRRFVTSVVGSLAICSAVVFARHALTPVASAATLAPKASFSGALATPTIGQNAPASATGGEESRAQPAASGDTSVTAAAVHSGASHVRLSPSSRRPHVRAVSGTRTPAKKLSGSARTHGSVFLR